MTLTRQLNYAAAVTTLTVVSLLLSRSFAWGTMFFGGRGLTAGYISWEVVHIVLATLIMPGLLAYVIWRWAARLPSGVWAGVCLFLAGVALFLVLSRTRSWIVESPLPYSRSVFSVLLRMTEALQLLGIAAPFASLAFWRWRLSRPDR
jgi:hypothetical protein